MSGGGERTWPSVPGYQVVGVLGRGGFGAVYEARQESVDRHVALKVISGTAFGEVSERRFRAECKTVGGLSWHHHVVSLFDAGVTPDGELYLVMELVPGGSVGDQVRDGEAMPAAVVRTIGMQIAEALGAAHAAGVLHRDVKPDNILIDRQGSYLLSDFGIATLDDGTRSTTGTFAGTYAYCAPELLEGERADTASDVYGLGATLYTLAAGRPAFSNSTDATPAAAILRIVSAEAAPLPPSVPVDLAAVIARAMAKDPADRFASADDLRSALESADLTRVMIQVPEPVVPQPVVPEPVVPEPSVEVDELTVRRLPAVGAPHAEAAPATELIGGLPAPPPAPPPAPAPTPPPAAPASSPPPLPPAPAPMPATPGGHRSRRLVAFAVAAAAVLVLVVLAAAILTRSSEGTYFVAFEGERAAVFRGQPDGVLGTDSDLVEITSLRRGAISAFFF